MSTIQPPGEHLKELLANRGLLQADLAFILGKAAPVINSITSGKVGISAEMSKALGKALQLPDDYFADLQQAYDLAQASDPDPTVTVRAAMLNKYPIREMIRRRWIKGTDADSLQKDLARFLGVSSPDEIPYLPHAAKKTKYGTEHITPAQEMWLFRVQEMANALTVPKYSERNLADALTRMRDFLPAPEEARHVPRLLAECGVRYVIVESLPHAKIDGVCFWLDKQSPVIGMSTFYDRIDNFWFCLRHEIEHVLNKDGMSDAVVDDFDGQTDDTLPEEERIANAAAAEFCVPQDKLDSFIKRKHPAYYEKDVLAFSKLHGIHPGIVVGQLQHRMKRYDYLRKYQIKIRHCVLPGAMVDGWGQTIPL